MRGCGGVEIIGAVGIGAVGNGGIRVAGGCILGDCRGRNVSELAVAAGDGGVTF